MKHLKTLLMLTATLTAAASAYSAAHGGAPMAVGEVKKESLAVITADMTDGEIRKVDMENKKITIKHGVIKNLDMPGMTMVFQVKDPAMLEKVKAGDKVRFTVEQAKGAIVITDIQAAK